MSKNFDIRLSIQDRNSGFAQNSVATNFDKVDWKMILSSLLSAFFVSLINTLTVHAMLTRKKTMLYCLVAFIINTLLVFCGAALAIKYILDSEVLKYLLYFLAFLYIAYIHIIFKESISKKIFTMFSVWMFSTSIFFLVFSFEDMFLGIVDEKHIQNFIYVIRIFLQILLLAAIYFWLSKPYKRVLGIVSDKTISYMSLYPVIAFLLLISNFGISFGRFRNYNSIYDILLFLGFISLGYLLVFAGISSSSKIISLQYNYKIIENQIELQRQNYKKLNESLDHIYAMKHDVRHHFSAINLMLQQQNYKEALEYTEQFNRNELTITMPTLCNNFAADSITKYYMSLAISKDIEFKAKLNIPEDIKINPIDLCIVLGNCLENSIEACEKLENDSKKYIGIESQIVDSYIVVKIVNSFDGQVIETGQTIQSRKNEFSHGIGITSVRETINKYRGNLDIKYSKDEFEVDIIMNKNDL